MKVLTTVLMGALVGSALLGSAGTARAQSRTLTGESGSVTVTIEAIDQSTRTLTVKDKQGIYETLEVPPAFTRFKELKVGDQITARYYENVVIRLKRPDEPAVDVDTSALTRGQAQPAGTLATQRTVTVTIAAKDEKEKSLTVTGPNGYKYSRRVADNKVWDKLKVGDRLDMTWTNALLISAETPK